jgi:UDP-2,3-diacylglucosamine pyrophosphatase LpxH
MSQDLVPLTRNSKLVKSFERRVFELDVGCFLGRPPHRHLGIVSGSDLLVVSVFFGSGDTLPLRSTAGRAFASALSAQGVGVRIRGEERAQRYRPNEKPGEAFTKDDACLVFIGDCHIGLRDAADNFHTKGDPTLRLLFAVVSAARASGATTVQLGDFVDVWEAEGDHDVFYRRKEGTFRSLPRGILERAEVAVTKLVDAWIETEMPALCEAIDTFIVGNHDAELHYTVLQFFHGERLLRPSFRASFGTESAIVAEHGHVFDRDNDTSNRRSLAALDKMEAKRLTMTWSALERDEIPARAETRDMSAPWVFNLDFEGDKVLVNTEEVFGRVGETLATSESPTRHKARRQLIALVDGYASKRLTEGTRAGCLAHTKAAFRDMNDGQTFAQIGSRSDYEIPVRVWVHGHTHDPDVVSFDFTADDFYKGAARSSVLMDTRIA